jgi:hypothetical protein
MIHCIGWSHAVLASVTISGQDVSTHFAPG